MGISPFAVLAAAFLVFSTAERFQAAAAETAGEAPVEFTYGGIAPDKTKFVYKIKVNTDKPIKEVHMNHKEMDASGKVLVENTVIWRNVVHSTEQPIEQGKTYEDYTMLNSGAVKAECSLAEVIFKDFTRWSATASAKATPTPAPDTKPPQTKEPPRVTESPAPIAPDRLAGIQAEVESFIKSVYRDMEQDDPDKVLRSFDAKVDYYSYGPKEKAFIAEQLRQYFAAFPIRSFSVGEVTLQAPPSNSRKVSVTFDVRYSLKDASKGATSTGRSHVEWDLIKPDKVIKIVRFTGTSYPDPAAP
ncbi:MAG: hypothetical protein DME97_02255 [Verrucomicrobia bacterium]|nr:MAG: hypothetical protein DME97_02255 [Verrucomicrobiota bacterium]